MESLQRRVLSDSCANARNARAYTPTMGSKVETSLRCSMASWRTHILAHDSGRLYICLTGFVVIFSNLGKRAPGTLSAYSVFNPNFEELPGTLNASQFEAEIMQRPLNSRPSRNGIQEETFNGEEYMSEQERRDVQFAIELSVKEAKRDERKRRRLEGKRGKKKR